MTEASQAIRLGAFDALAFISHRATDNAATAIIWLHGIGERGRDLTLVSKYGLPAALLAGRAMSNSDVICPQLPMGEVWEPQLVQSLIDAARSRYSAVSLLGFSLGGQGVLNHLACFGPTCALHVAIAPDAPLDPSVASRGANLIVVQGEMDFHPEVADFINKAKVLGASTTASVVSGGDHFISESWLQQADVQSALRAHGLHIELHEA